MLAYMHDGAEHAIRCDVGAIVRALARLQDRTRYDLHRPYKRRTANTVKRFVVDNAHGEIYHWSFWSFDG